MDEQRFSHLADRTLDAIESMLEDVDAEAVDLERSGGVITLTFRDKKKCVVNTQRPTRQIWLAARAEAYHFSFDEASKSWRDDKGRGLELLPLVAQIVRELSGVSVDATRAPAL